MRNVFVKRIACHPWPGLGSIRAWPAPGRKQPPHTPPGARTIYHRLIFCPTDWSFLTCRIARADKMTLRTVSPRCSRLHLNRFLINFRYPELFVIAVLGDGVPKINGCVPSFPVCGSFYGLMRLRVYGFRDGSRHGDGFLSCRCRGA